MTPVFSPEARADLQACLAAWGARHGWGTDLDQVDALAEAVARLAGEVAFAAGLAACGARGGYAGTRRPCPCGGVARFVQHRRRWVQGLAGSGYVYRAYYLCAACHTGQTPWDTAQGLGNQACTPRLRARVAELSARVTYREAKSLLTRLTGVALPESTLEHITLAVGAAIRAEEDAAVAAWEETGAVPPPWPERADNVGARVYLGIDAAKAHTGGGGTT